MEIYFSPWILFLLYVFWLHVTKFRTQSSVFIITNCPFTSKNSNFLKAYYLILAYCISILTVNVYEFPILYFQPPLSLIAQAGFCFLVMSEVCLSLEPPNALVREVLVNTLLSADSLVTFQHFPTFFCPLFLPFFYYYYSIFPPYCLFYTLLHFFCYFRDY